ncbi:hypothetical protein [Streptomyces sp. NPDC060194]|uniref:hypothetical protein n=1 Tax=Streptomyces sp. NPDC060194 TaxID=3347069 RepID=UPI00364F859A
MDERHMDEQILRGRVYGADHDDPDPGPRPGRAYVELVGGPLDGLLLDVTDWSPDRLREGAELATEIGRYGPGGRAQYAPRAGTPRRFDWQGDTR